MLTALGAVAGVFLVTLVIGAAAGRGSAPQSTASAPLGTAAASPAAASSAPAAKPHTVATFTGSGIQNTPRFTVTSTWKLAYSFDCSAFGGTGNFIVSEDGDSDFGGVTVDELGAGKRSSTWAYNDAGTHYLAVNSECSWTVKVIDEP